jgi:phosphoenolpyruvate---glycerone phosphotransferase subunit DhaL
MAVEEDAPMLSEAQLRALLSAAASTIAAHADELTALDAAIGDGDHGSGMLRGVNALLTDIDTIASKPLPDALKAIGTKIVMTVGGASGPLYGTLFLTLGKELAANPADLPAAFQKAVEAVAARGKSTEGQKTMLDVLFPVARALAAGSTGSELVAIAHAETAATRDRKALRGRASFLGDRSIGHVDPGARSSALLLETVVTTLGETPQ